MTAMRAAGITIDRNKFKIASSGKFGGINVSDSEQNPERMPAPTELGPLGNVHEVQNLTRQDEPYRTAHNKITNDNCWN